MHAPRASTARTQYGSAWTFSAEATLKTSTPNTNPAKQPNLKGQKKVKKGKKKPRSTYRITLSGESRRANSAVHLAPAQERFGLGSRPATRAELRQAHWPSDYDVIEAMQDLTKKKSTPIYAAQGNFHANGYNFGAGPNGPLNSEALQGDGSSEIISGARAAESVLSSMVDPFGASQTARFPDSFTMIPTAVDRDYVSVSTTWHNGTTSTDGSGAIYLRGEGSGNYVVPASISPTHAIIWNGGVGYNLLGTCPVTCLSRCTGAGWRLTYNGVGDLHDIIMNVMEFPPHAMITSTFTNFPDYTNVGPSTTQRKVFNARQFMMRSGETVQFTAYPMDSRCTDFATHQNSRADSSLSSYVIWWYGGRASDQMILESRIHFEFVVPNVTTVPVPSTSYATAVVKPNTAVFDRAMSVLTDAQAVGLNVVKGQTGTVSSVFDRALASASRALKTGGEWILDTALEKAGSYLFGGGLASTKWAPLTHTMFLGARRLPNQGLAEAIKSCPSAEDRPMHFTPQAVTQSAPQPWGAPTKPSNWHAECPSDEEKDDVLVKRPLTTPPVPTRR